MPRPIDHQLDSVFYTFYQKPKTGGLHLATFDENDPATWGELPSGYQWIEVGQGELHLFSPDGRDVSAANGAGPGTYSSRRKLAEDEDDEGADEPDLDDGFGGKKAPPFGSEERKNSSRSAGESTSDDFYGGDKPDDYYDDLNDGPEGEDKHPDPFVQRMREKQSGRRKIAEDNSSSGTGPSFSSPDSMRGSWKCNDCGADDLGVHDLNGHADAHRQTSHRG